MHTRKLGGDLMRGGWTVSTEQQAASLGPSVALVCSAFSGGCVGRQVRSVGKGNTGTVQYLWVPATVQGRATCFWLPWEMLLVGLLSRVTG
jgi:hypothetical protein